MYFQFCLIYSAALYTVSGRILSGPEDAEVVVGDRVRLRCKTSEKYSVNWDHISFGSQTPRDIYISKVVVKPYFGRFELKANSTTGEYDLIINSVEWKDAGRYECIDEAGSGERKAAELIVLGHHPKCSTHNIQHEFVGENECGVEPQDLQLKCSFHFSGNLVPKTTWRTTRGQIITPFETEKTILHHNHVDYSFKLKPEKVLDGQSLYYQTKLSNYSWTSEKIKILHVTNSSEVIKISQPKLFACVANSSQPCSYTWLMITEETKLNLSKNSTLEIDAPGKYICEAECQLRGKMCLIQPVQVEFTSHEDRTYIWISIPVTCLIVTVACLIGCLASFLVLLGLYAKKRFNMFL